MGNAYGVAVIHFRVLGRLEIAGEDGKPIDIGGRQARTVLTSLVLAEGRPVTADALIETLWGDEARESAVGTLQSYISRLRRQLTGCASLLYDNAGYRLEVDGDAIDMTAFERLAD